MLYLAVVHSGPTYVAQIYYIKCCNTNKQNVNNVAAGNVFVILSLACICIPIAPTIKIVVHITLGSASGLYSTLRINMKAIVGLNTFKILYIQSGSPASDISPCNVVALPTLYFVGILDLNNHTTSIDTPVDICNI